MSEEEKLIIDFLKKCKENKEKLIPLLQQSNEILLNYIDKLNNQLQQKENIIKEVREYITNYESISTIQGLNNLEVLNDGLDYKTIKEMTNRYLKVHDNILEILDKEVN